MGKFTFSVAVKPLVVSPLRVRRFAPSNFSRVHMIGRIRRRVCAFRAVRTDGRIDRVDCVLGKEQLGCVRPSRGRGIVGRAQPQMDVSRASLVPTWKYGHKGR
jgi:hypothetical protein